MSFLFSRTLTPSFSSSRATLRCPGSVHSLDLGLGIKRSGTSTTSITTFSWRASIRHYSFFSSCCLFSPWVHKYCDLCTTLAFGPFSASPRNRISAWGRHFVTLDKIFPFLRETGRVLSLLRIFSHLSGSRLDCFLVVSGGSYPSRRHSTVGYIGLLI